MSEQQKLGTENVEKVVMVVVEAANVADKMGHTKGPAKYSHVLSLFDEVTALGSAKISAVAAEIKDMDVVEKASILEKVKAKFDIIDDNLEAFIEKALVNAISYADAIQGSIDLIKDFKALKKA